MPMLIGLGGILTWHSYSRSSDMILSAAVDLFDQVSNELVIDFERVYRPVARAVDILSHSTLAKKLTLEDQLIDLPLVAEFLLKEPQVFEIQIARNNGALIIVRRISSEQLRLIHNATPDAILMVDEFIPTSEYMLKTRIFFNASLDVLKREISKEPVLDPRQAEWYKIAKDDGVTYLTNPRLIEGSKHLGINISRKSKNGMAVISAGITLKQLSQTLSRHHFTPSSEVVLMRHDGTVLAYEDTSQITRTLQNNEIGHRHVSELGSDVLRDIGKTLPIHSHKLDFIYNREPWQGELDEISLAKGVDVHLLLISPNSELLTAAQSMRNNMVVMTALIILLSLPLVWFASRRIAKPLIYLSGQMKNVTNFDFSPSQKMKYNTTEINALATTTDMMKRTIHHFLKLLKSTSSERSFDSLLTLVSSETMAVSGADAVFTYLMSETSEELSLCSVIRNDMQQIAIEDFSSISLKENHPIAQFVHAECPGFYQANKGDDPALDQLFDCIDSQNMTLICFPLRNRLDEINGALCLLYRHSALNSENYLDDHRIAFVHALSGFTSISLDSQHQIEMRKELLNSFIKVIAGAIDSKSPYTGGHCQRVPELTYMLARAAEENSDGPFESFSLSEDEWEALHIAGWLHDCGKVTTPEHIVDKATKLAGIYDRIHEIRMRFEVLKRDAEIDCWKQLHKGADSVELQKQLDDKIAELDEEFAFVGTCNRGGEFMTPESIERLENIASRTWMRTLDDQVGVSWEELEQKKMNPQHGLPCKERLLEDKPEHIIKRLEAEQFGAENPWGFQVDVPELKHNSGEIYNLTVARGTLTNEERYKINEHIIQTIIMLEKLPYPKHLRDIPKIAGGHHEKMDGTGYPKKLQASELPVTARMMAIADIFEALTASDRPYKKGKTVSEAINIMGFMKKDGHIDAELFELFIRSGVHLKYARKHLKPEQLDVESNPAC